MSTKKTVMSFVLALGLVFGVVEAKLRADSGGFFCCYGACSLQWDCDSANLQIEYLGGGMCHIWGETSGCSAIYVDIGSGWTGDPGGSSGTYLNYNFYPSIVN